MKPLPEPLRRLSLAFTLILLAAAMLLWSDRHSRHADVESRQAGTPIPVALLTHSSNPLLEETQAGIMAGLADRGFRDGEQIDISVYNPEGDLPTGNLMAQKIASGIDKLAISISTVMLQALANANRQGKIPQVFGAVTSPVGAGVGIQSLDTLNKPPQLTGIGTPQPVADIFRLAKKLNPNLKTVGVVWNPAEVNSEICTQRARDIARELGITLLEAPAEQTKDVREAAESLVSRGVEAFWTGGDATVNNALDSLMGVAEGARLPVFSNMAGHVRRGGLFDLGANYFEVGQEVGHVAGDILAGANPARLPVRDFVPRRLLLNEKVRQTVKGDWRFPEDIRTQAAEIILADGSVLRTEATDAAPASTTPDNTPPPQTPASPKAGTTAAPLDHTWKLKRILYVESAPAEEAMHGMDEGFRAAGLVAGRDFILREASAQGDMAVLPALADATRGDGTELLIAFSTPTLETAVQKIKHIPVVFTFVADPVVAGAGQDDTHHLPNITGVYTLGPYAEMADLLVRHFPGYRSIGTLFSPAEDNSVHNKQLFTEAAEQRGLRVTPIPVNSPGELPDAAMALAAKPIDVIVQILDNQSSSGFTAIARAARRARKPLISFTESSVRQGAALALTMDYRQAGYDAARKAADIMRGKPPATIPFSKPTRIRLVVSADNAQVLGMTLPADLIGKADLRLGKTD